MENKTNIYKSLAAFQQEVPIIHRDSKGYGYTYAGLGTIIETITPLLKKHGLGFTQLLNNDEINTIVFHIESGENLSSVTTLPVDSLHYDKVTKKDKKGNDYEANIILGFDGMNRAQAYGSIVTYFRRYALSSILGLVSDDDAEGRNKRKEYTEEKINPKTTTRINPKT